MTAGLRQALTGTVVGLVYWTGFSAISETREPWDGAFYWLAAYPGSLIIAVALGFAFRRRAWITGLSLTFAQLPIMIVNAGVGPTTLVAVAFLAVLAAPVILAAALTSK